MYAGSKVTITFEVTPNIDPLRFIEWLQVECGVAEDGDGAIHGSVNIVKPVTIQYYSGGAQPGEE